MPQKNVPGYPLTDGEQASFKHMLSHANLLYLGCQVLILLDRSFMSRFWTQVIHAKALPRPLVLRVPDCAYAHPLHAQFEAWLAMRHVTRNGLGDAPARHVRWSISLLYDCQEETRDALLQEWAKVLLPRPWGQTCPRAAAALGCCSRLLLGSVALPDLLPLSDRATPLHAQVTLEEAQARLSQPDVYVTNAGDKTEQLEKLSDLYRTVRSIRRAPTIRSGLFGSGRIEMPAYEAGADEPASQHV